MFTASAEGYLRLMRVKEQKNLEIVTQINVMDKILHAFPIEASEKETRTFAVVLHRGGIMTVRTCEEKAYQAK